MKKFIVIIFMLASCLVRGQHEIIPTNEFKITGKVKNEISFNISDLKAFAPVEIDNVVITNHKGEPKDTLENIKGILLKDILQKAEFLSESPKELSEFCIICAASDGYKVVFSWNEIFNTETGNHIYVITENDGVALDDMPDRIRIVSTSDFMTGRRSVKSLERIVIERSQ